MIRSSVRSAGLAILLTMNGCGSVAPSGSESAMPGLTVAEAALEGGAGQVALQVSEGVLRASPHNARAMAIKADALTLLGDYDEAVTIYQALLAKDLTSNRAATGLGRIKLTKDPAGAEALFQQVLKRAPGDMTAINNLGIARDLQGRHAEAQAAYRQALAINPDLDSAQVNLALSMAMSGQGAAAVQVLRTKASQPGAPVKMKHDYAVVLAMAGNRSEAERVLSNDLSPDEVRQVLDSVTGTHSRIARDTPENPLGRAALASLSREDVVPPDVVQVPEAPARPAPGGIAVLAAQSAPPPMIVRPHSVSEPDSDAPVTQPVNPIAAAVTNQRSLALPMRFGPGGEARNSGPSATTAPDVVAMPPARAERRWASVGDSLDGVGRLALPEAPPSPPILRPAPLPASMTRVEPPLTRTVAEATRPESDRQAFADSPKEKALAEIRRTDAALLKSPVEPALAIASTARAEPRASAAVGGNGSEAQARIEAAPMVQFAATASEEAARSFWQDLVRRFPEFLGRREPVVTRVERDGRLFWRVRAEGFATPAEAQTLCARLHAGGQDCFVPRS